MSRKAQFKLVAPSPFRPISAPKLAHVCHYLAALGGRAPDRPLFVCGAARRTAGEVAARVAALASALTYDVGVRPGDRVALITSGSAAGFEALLAVLAAGAVAAPLNTRWSAAEVADAADLIGATAVVFDARFAPTAAALLSGAPPNSDRRSKRANGVRRTGVCVGGADRELPAVATLSAEALIMRRLGSRLEPLLAPEGAAVICFTSGTTGAAKGVLLTHASFHCQVRPTRF